MAHGGKRKGAGRKAGSIDETTVLAREAISRFVDGNSTKLEGWLQDIAKENPKQAFDCFMSVVEYHIPKLARTEHTGKDGGPQEYKITKVVHSARDTD